MQIFGVVFLVALVATGIYYLFRQGNDLGQRLFPYNRLKFSPEKIAVSSGEDNKN